MTILTVHLSHAEETNDLLFTTPCRYAKWIPPYQVDCIAEFNIEVDNNSDLEAVENTLSYASIPYSLEILDDNNNTYCEWRDSRYDENGKMYFYNRVSIDPLVMLLKIQNLEHNPNLLIEHIHNEIKKYTPLPWINQDHYAKLHKLQHLIAM